jgi:hypothetical protein
MLALIDGEQASPAAFRGQLLRQLADQYAALGFRYHRASTLLHLAAVCYALSEDAAGDHALSEALDFGAAQGYRNFAWWHPSRMRLVLRRARAAGIEPEFAGQLLVERGLADTGPRLIIRCLGAFDLEMDGLPLGDFIAIDTGSGIPDHTRVIVGSGNTSTNQSDYTDGCGINKPIPVQKYTVLGDQHCIDRWHVAWDYNLILPNGQPMNRWYIHVTW